MKRYFTVGMAGHIDHGKTALTKTLTNVDTDRLKEEKERQISIELGFAPLHEDERMQISLIDVPGHERFIRKMIAGASGIDFVVLVVAADEGVMPQTLEHAEILSFLNIKDGIIALTKIDKVDRELINLAIQDIRDTLKGTMFADVSILPVSNATGEGRETLKSAIMEKVLSQPERLVNGDFRLPIDQVFTMKGQGTIVRGTIYDGIVREGEKLMLLPNNLEVKVRQIQVHHLQMKKAFAGQRAAINITGVAKEKVKRGCTLVSTKYFITTDTLDVNIGIVRNLNFPIKQRMPIKCYIGTTEVTGKIVFFDRNEVRMKEKEILCQLRLDSPIVAKRGDRIIIRRPSPYETIGGGWIIDPNGDKYKFGKETIMLLQKKMSGSLSERLFSLLEKEKAKGKSLLLKELSISLDELEIEIFDKDEWIVYQNDFLTHTFILEGLNKEIENKLNHFHQNYPLQLGLYKAELLQEIQIHYPIHLIEFSIKNGIDTGKWVQKGPFLLKKDFRPHLPSKWVEPIQSMLSSLKKDNWKVNNFLTYTEKAGIEHGKVEELIKFLIENGNIVALTPDIYWHKDIFQQYVEQLKFQTNSIFTMQDAKAILGFSRKYLVPFLEALDEEKITVRIDKGRIWK